MCVKLDTGDIIQLLREWSPHLFVFLLLTSIIISIIGVILCSILLNDTNIGKGLRVSMILALVSFCCIPVSLLIVVGLSFSKNSDNITIPYYLGMAIYIFFASATIVLQIVSLNVKKERARRTTLLQTIDILMYIGLVLEFLFVVLCSVVIYID